MQEFMDADEVKREEKKGNKAQLEQRFIEAWFRLFPNLPRPIMQHRFHPQRRWRFDFCFPEQLIAIEIDGGGFVRGAHNRAPQQAKDFEKQNAAVRMGWKVLRFNTVHMKDAEAVATEVAEMLTDAREVA
jgi:very-short-patch-repair endonuclease